MNFSKISESKLFKRVLMGIAALILLLIGFKIGIVVGYRKAHFSYRWGENYHRNFGGPRGGFFRDFNGDDFVNAHGISGSIIKVDADTLLIKGQDNVEKTIIVSSSTTIRSRTDTIKATDLKVDDHVVVVGSPNEQGQIEAKLIRLFR